MITQRESATQPLGVWESLECQHMIGVRSLATATLARIKIVGKLRPLVARSLDQQRQQQQQQQQNLRVILRAYTSLCCTSGLPRPQTIRSSSRISKPPLNQSQASGCLGRTASRSTIDAMPIRSLSTLKKSEDTSDVSAKAGHDLISFINASPTRKDS